jgi:uncharacterized membrane protein (DUF4010 family)
MPALLLAGAFLAALVVVGSLRTNHEDPGLTTEVAMLLTLLLGALAIESPRLAAGLGVVVASVLAMRTRLQRFATEVLSAEELTTRCCWPRPRSSSYRWCPIGRSVRAEP